MQGLLIPSLKHRRARAFTLVEIMVVVAIIGLLAAAALPAYRRITLRSKATAVVNDLRAFATPLITYSLQNGHWPADGDPQVVPPELAGAMPAAFTASKTPIGGVYKWEYDNSANGPYTKAAISIISVSGNPINDDVELLHMIDATMDDGDPDTGNIRIGTPNSLVYIIEQ